VSPKLATLFNNENLVNKKRVTYTDEELAVIEESELLTYINYWEQRRWDHKAAVGNLPVGSAERNKIPRLHSVAPSLYPGDSHQSRKQISYSVTPGCQRQLANSVLVNQLGDWWMKR